MFGGGPIRLVYRVNPDLGNRIEFMGNDNLVWHRSAILRIADVQRPILSYEDTWCEPTREMLYGEE